MLLFFGVGIFSLFTILGFGSIFKRMSLKQCFLSSLGAALSSGGFYAIRRFILPLFYDKVTTELINIISLFTEKVMYIFVVFSALFVITGIIKLLYKSIS